jgi:large subunit ribosomal protein L6
MVFKKTIELHNTLKFYIENNKILYNNKVLLKALNNVELEIKHKYLIISSNDLNILILQKKKINLIIFQLLQGFKVKLTLIGIGYKYFLKENKIYFKLNKSHLIYFNIPEKIIIYQLNTTNLLIKSTDLLELMSFVRKLRITIKPNVFKKKGLFINNEQIILKKKK